MEYFCTNFGGILLQTRNGSVAINGGAKMEQLKEAYLTDGKAPAGMILTCEHVHRSRNAARFAEEYRLPVLGSMLTLAQLHWYPLTPGSTQILPPQKVDFCGIQFSCYHLRYDAIDPFYLIAEGEGKRIGFVFDGKLNEENAGPLRKCDELFLSNSLNLPADSSGSLARRLRSITNTDNELETLFHSFTGRINQQ